MCYKFVYLIAALGLTVTAVDAVAAEEHAEPHTPLATEHEGAPHDHEVLSTTHLERNMKAMRDVMTRIAQAKDPAEKQRLLNIHMLAMLEQIRTIRALHAQAGHDHGAHEHGSKGSQREDSGTASATGTAMQGCRMLGLHQQTEERVSAVEQLLEQLLEHEAAREKEGSQSR